MKIALVGYGAMGHLVGKLAVAQGHEIATTIDIHDAANTVNELAGALKGSDVAVDFSIAAAVPKNAEASAIAGVPLVVGTTAWLHELPKVKSIVSENDGALVYGSNFSVGAQIFFRIAQFAAGLFQHLESYDAFIEEAHHKRKVDAPSGTALQLGKIVSDHLGRDVPISSTRAGHIPGTHRVGFDSSADHITLEHVARSREGFALGALMAAKWIIGRKGVYEYAEVFDEILATKAQRRGEK
jgi:4-hydroxy-tetrahydrodipicolinate reductase